MIVGFKCQFVRADIDIAEHRGFNQIGVADLDGEEIVLPVLH